MQRAAFYDIYLSRSFAARGNSVASTILKTSFWRDDSVLFRIEIGLVSFTFLRVDSFLSHDSSLDEDVCLYEILLIVSDDTLIDRGCLRITIEQTRKDIDKIRKDMRVVSLLL